MKFEEQEMSVALILREVKRVQLEAQNIASKEELLESTGQEVVPTCSW